MRSSSDPNATGEADRASVHWQRRLGSGPQLRAVALAVLVRPWLWAIAVRQASALAGPGWWRRRPYLPVPDPAYLAFRLETMYGDATRALEPRDVVTYLRWCGMQRRGLR